MAPPLHNAATAKKSFAQMARCPRDSDGVGDALRKIFRDSRQTPSDFAALLNRLNAND